MQNSNVKRHILAIDLKSFFASCECVDRGLDPFTTPLVVADPARGTGAITLATSPALKKMGVRNRARIFEIPRHINYLRVKPRMSLYMQKSKEVTDVYLEFVSLDDLYQYSIDEVFIDVTDYLKMYKKTDYELAEEIIATLYKKTGLSVTCGIGPNILLAKIAMDVEAKKYKNSIAKWDYEDIETKLWPITPLSKIWGIGPKMEKKLNAMGMYKVEDIAKYDLIKLKQKFGVMGEELWNHANGIDNDKISDFKEIPKEKSMSHSQVLFKDYYGSNIKIIIEEMVEVLAARLRNEKKLAGLVGFGIGYSKDTDGGFYHSLKLDSPTDNIKSISEICFMLLDRYYIDGLPIRRVNISLARFSDKDFQQLNIFEEPNDEIIRDNIYSAIDEVREKFGNNSVIRASGLLPDSTMIERNKKIKGHNIE